MDKQRIVIAATGLAIAVVLALGYLLGVQPQLAAAGAANEQIATTLASNQAAEAQLAKLKQDYDRLSTYKDQLSQLQQSVPSSQSLDAMLSDLRALAASTGTTISQFNSGEPVAYVPPAAPAATAPSGAATSGSSPSPTPTSTAPAAPAAPRTTTNSLITAGDFVAIPVTIGVQGGTDAAIAFLGGLQHGKRLVLVTGFTGTQDASSAPAAGGAAAAGTAGSTYTITGLVYVLGAARPTAAAAAPSSTGATTAPTPAATPSR
ncbi:type 4a pilus biogenesis protein PilO [Leifsonia sp. 22587]|uniref:type 4a pilus biogenesis protein PilO n=1 Tax=Leifsonia sp. 22587 TaxID=3453946 RepID=UPI003F85445E